MKKILAFLLCAVLLLTVAAPAALAETVTETFQICDGTGAPVKTVSLRMSEKMELTAVAENLSGSYQWQIHVSGDVWANIMGANGNRLELSYGLVANLLSGNVAEIRCRLTNGEVRYTDPVKVQIQSDATVRKAPAAAPVSGTAPNGDPADGPAPSTYVITIQYQFADGEQAANSWTATVAIGSTYTQDVASPVIVGYTPDPDVVHVNASETTTYTVTYKPAEVDFTVKHYQQNVSDDKYTLVDTETKKGYTKSAVGEGLARTDYEGFYSLLYDTTMEIAADGSTVVEIYYDRYYYLMNFDLDGGYGVEPIYARYGAAISVSEPTKPGYTFTGWTPAIPATMPAQNTSYAANWEIGTSGFTVVFWYENANDDGYSVAGTYQPANVKPGTEQKSDDYKNQSFDGRDDTHFTYNTGKVETVTVKGDGSTVLNVYYTRNAYTLTFKDGNIKIVCGKVEHEHSHEQCCTKTGLHLRCNSNKCPVGYEHEHTTGGWGTASCYKYSDLTITAKYQADIHNNFPIRDGNATIWWDVPDGCKSFKPGTQLGSIDTMPGENITFTSAGADSGAVLWYYVETLNGAAGEYTHNGRNFKLYKKIDIEQSGRLTYTEEFHNITGFTQWWSDPAFSKMEQGGTTSGVNKNNYLCYTRNSYNLSFYNYNAYVTGKDSSVQFEAPLSGYDFKPEYPANLEKNAYVFDGWYTTAGCYEGSKADLNTMTMPASDVILYAKWTPKTHTVKTYLTKDVMDNGGTELDIWTEVPHGTTVEEPDAPTNGAYTFVGWFYISDSGEEKAFDFSMPVNRDLNLYAKWSSNTLVRYTVKYAVENSDGTLTYIADDTTGSALAGTTKTFDAKTGTELKEDYRSGYFPKVSSHSLTMDIHGGWKNVFTFIYVAREKVKYTVRYLDRATGEPVVVDGTPTPDKEAETSSAVVTEPFKQIAGYAPDAYQKQLVLAAEGNVITFWYVKDEVHAPVRVVHWIQNIAGEGYTEYRSSTNLNGVIGNTYSETPLEIPGFQFNGTRSNASGKLDAGGLLLELYYDRIEYPYVFQFIDQATGKEIADSEGGKARYQAQVTQAAKDIPGYKLVGTENQAINIAIEDPDHVTGKNVKIFYYTEETVSIQYKVVGPTGCGTLDNYQENNLKVLTGTAAGSNPTAVNGYKFVGWYTDEACTRSVDTAWIANDRLTPQKTKPLGSEMGYEAATYYAKFELDVFDLTIRKVGCAEIDENQGFLFRITGPNGFSIEVTVQGNGSKTIQGLQMGEYTVTEVESWSWRYQCQNNNQVVKSENVTDGEASVTFTNKRDFIFWLNGCAFADNRWRRENA